MRFGRDCRATASYRAVNSGPLPLDLKPAPSVPILHATNAYCQDNELSWFDWGLVQKDADVHRFVTLLNARRRLRNTEIERQRISLNRLLCGTNLQWHGVKIVQPDWRMSSHSIALTVEMPDERITVHLIANAYWEALDFELPQIGRPVILWRR